MTRPLTIAFWKPYDVLSKFTDETGRATLADYIDIAGMYSAGRLDRDSEGLLILSQDPALRGLLTEPRHRVERIYWAQVEGLPNDDALAQLADGVVVQGRRTAPATALRLAEAPDLPPRPVPIRVRASIPDSWIELGLREGRNRQVRRMTAAVGHPTLRLVRCAVGSVGLEGLEPGRWRELTHAEVQELSGATRLGSRSGSRRRRGQQRRMG